MLHGQNWIQERLIRDRIEAMRAERERDGRLARSVAPERQRHAFAGLRARLTAALGRLVVLRRKRGRAGDRDASGACDGAARPA